MTMSKYELVATTSFKKDYKKLVKRQYNITLLDEVVEQLLNGNPLPEKNKDHALTGNWKGFRECHIMPDWLLVYRIYEDKLILSLIRTGSHSDLDF